MGLNLPAYRVTPDDLPDADKKTARALGPLLDALNRALGAVVAALNALALPALKATSFTTDAAGSAYVDLRLGAPATELWVSGLAQDGGSMNFVYSSSWAPTSSGARLLFVGLAASTTYSLKVRYL